MSSLKTLFFARRSYNCFLVKKGNGTKDKFWGQLWKPQSMILELPAHCERFTNVAITLGLRHYAMINYHTQWRAWENSREETLAVLKENYVPLLKKFQAIPIFSMMAGSYIPNTRGTDDLVRWLWSLHTTTKRRICHLHRKNGLLVMMLISRSATNRVGGEDFPLVVLLTLPGACEGAGLASRLRREIRSGWECSAKRTEEVYNWLHTEDERETLHVKTNLDIQYRR